MAVSAKKTIAQWLPRQRFYTEGPPPFPHLTSTSCSLLPWRLAPLRENTPVITPGNNLMLMPPVSCSWQDSPTAESPGGGIYLCHVRSAPCSSAPWQRPARREYKTQTGDGLFLNTTAKERQINLTRAFITVVMCIGYDREHFIWTASSRHSISIQEITG